MRCVDKVTVLNYRMRRLEEEMSKPESKAWMSGRQALRLILNHYKTDDTGRQLFGMHQLENLPWAGDEKIGEFYETWCRMALDQRINLSEEMYEQIFWRKLQKSKVLQPYTDRYRVAKKGDPEQFKSMHMHNNTKP